MIAHWNEHGLREFSWLPVGQPVGCEDAPADSAASDFANSLEQYFQSGRADFSNVPLDRSDWTPFRKRVYAQCQQIPFGETRTYKELAVAAGSPGASRAVGAAMACNRTLLIIPCHRVVSSGGGLRGFSAPGGLQTKQFLLDLETQ